MALWQSVHSLAQLALGSNFDNAREENREPCRRQLAFILIFRVFQREKNIKRTYFVKKNIFFHHSVSLQSDQGFSTILVSERIRNPGMTIY